MKKLGLSVFVISFLLSCSSPTQITSSWKDPNTTITHPGVHKIVVAALIYDQGVRRQVEDYMASLYPGTAMQSYLILGGDSLISQEQAYSQKLQSAGYDGIVIMKQVTENLSQHYVPGQYPSYYSTWGGYWGNGWGGRGWGTTFYNPGTPGHFQTDRTWIVQVNVYSLITNRLIWAANTRTTDPGGRIPLFDDVCKAVRSQMKSDGFLN
jgi:hypothetical protein